MNVLEEVILTKTPEEIQSMYDQFVENREYMTAAKLRTSFILHEYFNSEEISPILSYMILEETHDIEARLYGNANSIRAIKESNEEIREFTSINALLYMKLLKNETVSTYTNSTVMSTLIQKITRELSLITDSEFWWQGYFAIIELLCSKDSVLEEQGYMDTLALYGERKVFFLNDFYNQISYIKNKRRFPNIPTEETNLEQFYNTLTNWHYAVTRYENLSEATENELREALILVMCIYLYNGEDLPEMQIMLFKALELTPLTHYAYWTLKFLEKEFMSNVETTD